MLWVYVLLTTVGVVAIVPTVLRAIDGHTPELITGFAGFVGFFGGITGLLGRQAGVPGLATFIAAAAIGLASGALHPEFLSMLRGESSSPDSPVPAPAAAEPEKKPKLTHDES